VIFTRFCWGAFLAEEQCEICSLQNAKDVLRDSTQAGVPMLGAPADPSGLLSRSTPGQTMPNSSSPFVSSPFPQTTCGLFGLSHICACG
jgi:hypothetical protein